MKKIISLTLFLALASALAGAVLAGVNSITSPIIEEQKIAAVKATLKEIFPSATEFAEVKFEDASGKVNNVYEAKGQGFALKVTVQGYKDIITFLIGYDLNGEAVGFKVVSINDTPGIGMRIGDQEFADLVIGSSVPTPVDTLAGATVSSSAVVKGIEAAIVVFKTLAEY
ncbi:MAG: FMN-binding protein [Erysipelotrichaceae bacterium]|nr:FMN-binding protein [Erysipelotrichaceae bacterium]